MLLCLVYVCDELLQEGVGKALLNGWSVQLLRLHTPEKDAHNSEKDFHIGVRWLYQNKRHDVCVARHSTAPEVLHLSWSQGGKKITRSMSRTLEKCRYCKRLFFNS